MMLACAIVVLAGCQTEAFLEVQVDDDGGGAVYVALAMDQDAAAKSVLFESKPPNLIPVADLTKAGWTVSGPTQEQDGRIWMRASKPFSQLDQLTEVVHEVAGPDGPFRNFKVERSSGFAERSWQFSGTVDLSKGIASFSDEQVAAAFAGEPLGQPAAIIAAQVGTTLEAAVKLNVVVDLPGDLGANNGAIGSAGLAAATTVSTKTSTAVPAGAVPTSGGAGTNEGTAGSGPLEGQAGVASTSAVRGAGEGAAVVWNPSFADGTVTELSARSSSSRLLPRVWRWAALVAALVGGAALLYRVGQALLDGRLDRRRGAPRAAQLPGGGRAVDPLPLPFGRFGDAGPVEPSPLVTYAPAAGVAVSAGAGVSSPEGTGIADGSARLSLIIIETTGALVAGRDPLGDGLMAFARERGCVLSARQVGELYLARSVGGLSGADFWGGLGLTGDPMLLDDTYARRFELTIHVVDFLAQARERGVRVAALGDDVPEWTSVFRQRFKLDGLITSWISSAEVGVRVPHPALLEAAARATGVAPAQTMVIAASRPLLDSASRLGYRTVHYNPGLDDPESDHPILRTFAERARSVEAPSAPGASLS